MMMKPYLMSCCQLSKRCPGVPTNCPLPRFPIRRCTEQSPSCPTSQGKWAPPGSPTQRFGVPDLPNGALVGAYVLPRHGDEETRQLQVNKEGKVTGLPTHIQEVEEGRLDARQGREQRSGQTRKTDQGSVIRTRGRPRRQERKGPDGFRFEFRRTGCSQGWWRVFGTTSQV